MKENEELHHHHQQQQQQQQLVEEQQQRVEDEVQQEEEVQHRQQMMTSSIVQRRSSSQDIMIANKYGVLVSDNNNNIRIRNSDNDDNDDDVNQTIMDSHQLNQDYASLIEASVEDMPVTITTVTTTTKTTSTSTEQDIDMLPPSYANRHNEISGTPFLLLPNNSIIVSSKSIESSPIIIQSSDNNVTINIVTIKDASTDRLRPEIPLRIDDITDILTTFDSYASTGMASSSSSSISTSTSSLSLSSSSSNINNTVTSSRDIRSYPWVVQQQSYAVDTDNDASTSDVKNVSIVAIDDKSRPIISTDESILMRNINVLDTATTATTSTTASTIPSSGDIWYDSVVKAGIKTDGRKYFDHKVVLFEKMDRSMVELKGDGSIALARNASTINPSLRRQGGGGGLRESNTAASSTSSSPPPTTTASQSPAQSRSDDSSIKDTNIDSPSGDHRFVEESVEASAFWDNDNILQPPQIAAGTSNGSANNPVASIDYPVISSDYSVTLIDNPSTSIDNPISSPNSSDLSSTSSIHLIYDMTTSPISSSLSSTTSSTGSSYESEVIPITAAADISQSLSDGNGTDNTTTDEQQ
jgi:hypothetical protein